MITMKVMILDLINQPMLMIFSGFKEFIKSLIFFTAFQFVWFYLNEISIRHSFISIDQSLSVTIFDIQFYKPSVFSPFLHIFRYNYDYLFGFWFDFNNILNYFFAVLAWFILNLWLNSKKNYANMILQWASLHFII